MCAGERWHNDLHHQKFPSRAERLSYVEPVSICAKFSRGRSFVKTTKTSAQCQGEESETTGEQREGENEDAQPQRCVPGSPCFLTLAQSAGRSGGRDRQGCHNQLICGTSGMLAEKKSVLILWAYCWLLTGNNIHMLVLYLNKKYLNITTLTVFATVSRNVASSIWT
jgi:hypothetical protein